MVLKIYKSNLSPPSRAVMMTATILGLKPEYLDINIAKREQMNPEFIKKNAQHTVPLLEDGDFLVWDSHAIITYLVTVYGKDDTLYPNEPKKRALIDQKLHFDSGILFARLWQAVIPLIRKGATSIAEEQYDAIRESYGFLDAFLENQSFLVGDFVTVADICCIATTSALNELLPVDAKTYPNLTKWMSHMMSGPFYTDETVPSSELFGQLVRSRLSSA